MYNRYSDRKSTAATKLANMMLELSTIRLGPIYQKAKETQEISANDWRIIYEITGVLKVIAPFGEDSEKPPSQMTNEELLALVEELKGLKDTPDMEMADDTEDDEDEES